MFIVWSRLGFLGVIIPIVAPLIGLYLSEKLFGKGYYPSVTILGISFVVSGIVIWFLGRYLNASSKTERKLIDPETNEEVLLKSKHTIFWIPLEYFAIPVILLGAVWLIL